MKRVLIGAVICTCLILLFAAAGQSMELRKGFSAFTTTGYYFHIHDTVDSEYSFSGSIVPVGTSFAYSIRAASFGGGFEYLAGLGDYEGLATVYYESRFFLKPDSQLSPLITVSVGPHFLTDYVGVMARFGGGIDYRSGNVGGYAEFGYMGVLPDVAWAGDYSYWIGNLGFRAGLAATF